MDEWELSKENAQPAKSGRNVDVLNAALKAKADGNAHFSNFEHERSQFLNAIQGYTGDDPLDPWIRYIKWVNDAFPESQSVKMAVLEKFITAFPKEERYCRDVRYLQVWIQYADCCTDPSDVFAFLEVNEIGQDFALFYEAYAIFMEVRKNFSKADDIYQLGVQRSAQPLERLENKYKSFLFRMAKRDEKQFLGDGALDNIENIVMNAEYRGWGSSTFLADAKRSSRTVPAHHLPPRASRTEKTKQSVFNDLEFSKGASQDQQRKANPMLPANSNAWYHFANEGEKQKENTQLPSKWNGIQVGKKAQVQLKSGPDLKIFVDEEFTK